jgi:carbamoyltransferase
MYILGISCFYHDSAASLLKDGEIIAAAQEERFTRTKHDAAFPEHAIRYCLKQAGIGMDDVDYVAYYEKPHLKLERILTIYADNFPRSFKTFGEVFSQWMRYKFKIPAVIKSSLAALSPTGGRNAKWLRNIIYCEHHMSHAASAFYPSPFREAAILNIDGVGEWSTTTLCKGGTKNGVPAVDFLKEMKFPNSLGMLYSAFTYFLGFKVNSGEYKVMGLAPYGEPVYFEMIMEHLIDLKEDGSFQVNLDYFTYPYDHIMIHRRFEELFGFDRRKPESKLEKQHFDMAASIQKLTETVVIRICKHLHAITQSDSLCLSGGVALNCVANGKIMQATPFKDVWVQPAAGDAGGALGAALFVWHDMLKQPRPVIRDKSKDLMKGAYLGPAFSEDDIVASLKQYDLAYDVYDDPEALYRDAAALIANEKIIGLFNGRMEFGPRALGGRSIIGDPRSANMQKTMNLKIKFRESFRPFAPAVMREHVNEWFDLHHKEGSLLKDEHGYDSPYMLMVAPVREHIRYELDEQAQQLQGLDKLNHVRSVISSCTHVDYSARIQTVTKETNPCFYGILSAFNELTGCPVLINTSFNVRGEPIVCTPEDAVKCFLGTDIDCLVLGNVLLQKEKQSNLKRIEYHERFELD